VALAHRRPLMDNPGTMLNEVVKVESLSGFRLRVHFGDGYWGEHDFADLVKQPGEMLEPLLDPTYFARAFLDYGALTWPNGYDMCPDWLRQTMETAGELRQAATIG